MSIHQRFVFKILCSILGCLCLPWMVWASNPSTAILKKIAIEYYTQLYSPDYEKAMQTYLHDDYIEHQKTAKYSRAGLASYVKSRLETYPNHRVLIYRAVAQNDMVFLHVEEKRGPGAEMTAVAELFRFAEGRIIEHWMAFQDFPKKLEKLGNFNGVVAGPNVNPNSQAGQQYAQATVDAMIKAFVKFETEGILSSFSPRYIQHTIGAADGPESLLGVVDFLKSKNLKTSIDVKHIVAEGDFVVILSLFTGPPMIPHTNVFDIFRLTEDGKKDEHWDVNEEIEPDDVAKIF